MSFLAGLGGCCLLFVRFSLTASLSQTRRVNRQLVFDFFDQVAERYADPLYTSPE